MGADILSALRGLAGPQRPTRTPTPPFEPEPPRPPFTSEPTRTPTPALAPTPLGPGVRRIRESIERSVLEPVRRLGRLPSRPAGLDVGLLPQPSRLVGAESLAGWHRRMAQQAWDTIEEGGVVDAGELLVRIPLSSGFWSRLLEQENTFEDDELALPYLGSSLTPEMRDEILTDLYRMTFSERERSRSLQPDLRALGGPAAIPPLPTLEPSAFGGEGLAGSVNRLLQGPPTPTATPTPPVPGRAGLLGGVNRLLQGPPPLSPPIAQPAAIADIEEPGASVLEPTQAAPAAFMSGNYQLYRSLTRAKESEDDIPPTAWVVRNAETGREVILASEVRDQYGNRTMKLSAVPWDEDARRGVELFGAVINVPLAESIAFKTSLPESLAKIAASEASAASSRAQAGLANIQARVAAQELSVREAIAQYTIQTAEYDAETKKATMEIQLMAVKLLPITEETATINLAVLKRQHEHASRREPLEIQQLQEQIASLQEEREERDRQRRIRAANARLVSRVSRALLPSIAPLAGGRDLYRQLGFDPDDPTIQMANALLPSVKAAVRREPTPTERTAQPVEAQPPAVEPSVPELEEVQ